MKRRLNIPLLSDRQDFIMRHILEKARRNQNTYVMRLARKLEWNPYRVYAAVDALEKKGYVFVTKIPGATLVWPLRDEHGLGFRSAA